MAQSSETIEIGFDHFQDPDPDHDHDHDIILDHDPESDDHDDDATPRAHWLTANDVMALSQWDRMVGGWRDAQLTKDYIGRLSRRDWCYGFEIGLEGATGGRIMYRFPRFVPMPRPPLPPLPPPHTHTFLRLPIALPRAEFNLSLFQIYMNKKVGCIQR